ncbi:hypothetical protein [Paenibacillus xylanexedens]|uniref:hypothetical protein n=1 Tax=Paenibacillus xylanexedens TaxID=528191 RepID=UPI000F53300B|nr:hypothetical protein [Paenibacillus xylanexedens]RPK20024.1 hypothetical protein EDO6_06541 [Paenibacillus xylanexedens]
MNKMDEIIVVVPRNELFKNEKLAFQGTLLNDGESVSQGMEIINNMENHYGTMRRGDAEVDVDFKQPIPYAVIRRGDKIFVYKRLAGGGETRLHDKLSIGVGGHMNDMPEEEKALIEDFSFYTLLTDNLERELSEELEIGPGARETEIIGLINDDSQEVSKVHIGVLVVIDIEEDVTVEVNEPEQLEGFWLSITDLMKPEVHSKLESWSQIAAEVL